MSTGGYVSALVKNVGPKSAHPNHPFQSWRESRAVLELRHYVIGHRPLISVGTLLLSMRFADAFRPRVLDH